MCYHVCPLKIANITSLLIKYRLFSAPISREAHKSESPSNEVTMAPHCTLCEVASRMKTRNVEGGSRRHHSRSGIPKYKTWLERRGGRKGGGGTGVLIKIRVGPVKGQDFSGVPACKPAGTHKIWFLLIICIMCVHSEKILNGQVVWDWLFWPCPCLCFQFCFQNSNMSAIFLAAVVLAELQFQSNRSQTLHNTYPCLFVALHAGIFRSTSDRKSVV